MSRRVKKTAHNLHKQNKVLALCGHDSGLNTCISVVIGKIGSQELDRKQTCVTLRLNSVPKLFNPYKFGRAYVIVGRARSRPLWPLKPLASQLWFLRLEFADLSDLKLLIEWDNSQFVQQSKPFVEWKMPTTGPHTYPMWLKGVCMWRRKDEEKYLTMFSLMWIWARLPYIVQ